MARQVVFHRLAAREAHAAEEWYARLSDELASRFRKALDDAVMRIGADVDTHRVGTTQHHYVRIARFPYRLIFHVEGELAARVVAVAHFRRRPGYWRRRV